MPDLISTAEAAKILGCSRKWINDLINYGRLPAQRVGAYWVIDRKDVIAYKQRQASDKPAKGQQ